MRYGRTHRCRCPNLIALCVKQSSGPNQVQFEFMRLFNRFFQFLVCALVGGLFRSEFFERRLGLLVGLNQGFLAPCKLTLHVVQYRLGTQFCLLKFTRLYPCS